MRYIIYLGFFILTGVNGFCQPDNARPFLPIFDKEKPDAGAQISEYIPRVFEDKRGNLWIATNGDGICCYDGKGLHYYGVKDGLGGKIVRAIAEDVEGNLWFGTEGGLTKLTAGHFTNYTTKNGLPHNEIWSILIDHNGVLWVGTLEGACRYNAKSKKFNSFPIPSATKRDYTVGVTNPKVIFSMAEDKVGNIWFASNGGGVFGFDGKKIQNLSEKDGLSNDFVQCVLVDKHGKIWCATRRGGVSVFDQTMAMVPGPKRIAIYNKQNGLSNNECWYLYEDRTGNIWIATAGTGIDRYDGKTFRNFREKAGVTRNHVQGIFEDKGGVLWFGFSGGLFRLDGSTLINVTKNGPWLKRR